jgi:hypothetical protein
MKKVFFTLSIVVFLLSFSYTNAQLQTPIDGVTISNSPTNPTPGENVKVSVESFLLDLNSSSIVWLSNGTTIGHGMGMKEITVKAPSVGKKLVVSAAIKTNDGREIQKAVVIKSGSVDLILETNGYTPPFFKGKNPFVYQNEIKLIAVPHLSLDGINEVDPRKLVYQWKQGGKYIDGASGYGKQSAVIVTDNIPKDIEVSLNVYTQDQSQSSEKTITLSPTEPSVSFYEIDPLYGIFFNREVGSRFDIKNSETTILSSPFGFSKKGILSYNWSINNVEQPDLSKNQSITLRTNGDTDGSSSINLEIRGVGNILQGAQSSFTAFFKKRVTEDVNTSF